MLVVCSRSKCKRLADPSAMPVNKNSRSGELKKPMCPNCLASRTRELERCRVAPTDAYIAKIKRSNETQKGSSTAQGKSNRCWERKKGGNPSQTAHRLVHDSLRRTLKKGCDSARILQVTGLASGADLCAHFHNLAVASGFPLGLAQHGPGDDQWSLSHKIPQHAYDGTNPVELAKCWDLRNIMCESKRDNCARLTHFDESQVPVTLYPADWNGLPCTLQRRQEIEAKVAAYVV